MENNNLNGQSSPDSGQGGWYDSQNNQNAAGNGQNPQGGGQNQETPPGAGYHYQGSRNEPNPGTCGPDCQNGWNSPDNGYNNYRSDWNGNYDYRDMRRTAWNSTDSTGNPYYNQPTHSPYRYQGFAIASLVLGVLSLLTSCLGVLSIPAAALSILFAIMSYRKGRKMNSMAVSGLAMSCVGVVSGIVVLVRAFTMLPDMMQDPAYRQQMDSMSEALYGKSFEELLKDAYGIEIGE